MPNIDVDTSYMIGKNGISRDAIEIIHLLSENNKITNVMFFKNALNSSRFLRRVLNLLNLFFNLHLSIGKKYDGIFFQPHLSLFKPGKNSTGWVIRVHDLFPISNPEWFRWWANVIFQRNLNFAVKNGATFLFSSEYSMGVFLKLFPIGANRVFLWPCRASTLSQIKCGDCQGCGEIETNPNQERTLIAVGTIEPRKNYDFLVDFWKLYSRQIPSITRLLVIGAPGWKSKKIQANLKSVSHQNLTWLKNCCDGSLKFFYQNSQCFISASINEGFNLPALEARTKFGLPVYLSDIPVHREIHGDFAHYFSNASELYLKLRSKNEHFEKSWGSQADPDKAILNFFFNNLT